MIARTFAVAEYENAAVFTARLESDAKVMAADRRPAVRYAVAARSGCDGLRLAGTVVETDKGVTARIEAVDIFIYIINCVMIPSFAELSLVIDSAALDLDLAGRQIALEIGRIILRIPETEFNIAVQIYASLRVRIISERDPCQLAAVPERDEDLLLCRYSVL